MALYLDLFWSFFQIGLFSIGGGMAAMPLIQNQVVNVHGWLTMTDFANIVTISEMTPGPIAINGATFVGSHVGGFWGAVAATLGCVTPSCIIVLLLAFFYFKYRDLKAVKGVIGGLRPAVVAMIASAGLGLVALALFEGSGKTWGTAGFGDVNLVTTLLFAASLVALRKWKPNPILVMVSSGVLGLVIFQFV